MTTRTSASGASARKGRSTRLDQGAERSEERDAEITEVQEKEKNRALWWPRGAPLSRRPGWPRRRAARPRVPAEPARDLPLPADFVGPALPSIIPCYARAACAAWSPTASRHLQ